MVLGTSVLTARLGLNAAAKSGLLEAQAFEDLSLGREDSLGQSRGQLERGVAFRWKRQRRRGQRAGTTGEGQWEEMVGEAAFHWKGRRMRGQRAGAMQESQWEEREGGRGLVLFETE